MLSQFFVGDRTVQDTLHRISELATEAIPSAQMVGMTILVDGRKRTAVFTDVAAPEIDQAQYDTGEGPCVRAFQTGQVFRINSTLAEGPFAAFRETAATHGIRSTLSVPMLASDEALGAMNLYCKQENGFSADDERVATEFAGHAAVVLANAQAYWDAHALSLRLQESIEHRAIIEQAKGLLMATQRCSADDAFELLVSASQRENVKLRIIAQRLVERATSDSAPVPDDA